MKTYTKKDRDPVWEAAVEEGQIMYAWARWHSKFEPIHCECAYWTIQSNFNVPTAWEDCPNCLGFGTPPIPMSEVK